MKRVLVEYQWHDNGLISVRSLSQATRRRWRGWVSLAATVALLAYAVRLVIADEMSIVSAVLLPFAWCVGYLAGKGRP